MAKPWIFQSRKALKIEFENEIFLFRKSKDGVFTLETTNQALIDALLELRHPDIFLISAVGYQKRTFEPALTPAELSMRA